jgi:hypothetical protein
MSTHPIESLELRALEQRNRLHDIAGELKRNLAITREKFDVSRTARTHFVTATIAVLLFGFLSGYGVAGMFTDY